MPYLSTEYKLLWNKLTDLSNKLPANLAELTYLATILAEILHITIACQS
jgi:hypothetical protein